MTQLQSKAVLLEQPGPLPKPVIRAAARPKRQEVLLRVRSSSVNFHDYVLCTCRKPSTQPCLVWAPDTWMECEKNTTKIDGLS